MINLPSVISSDSFVFRTGHRILVTNGMHCSIQCASNNGFEFSKQIEASLDNARNAGIRRPIICGSLAFDMHKPANLFIPETYAWFEQKHTATHISPTTQTSNLSQTAKVVSILAQKESYKKAVIGLLKKFQKGGLNKVVLARQTDVFFDEDIDQARLVRELLRAPPECYVFVVPTPRGRFVGMSPELLLAKKGNKVTSNPLAGSRATSDFILVNECNELLHSSKDRREHQLVVDHVANCLRSFCYELDVPNTPQVKSVPGLVHLSTIVRGQTTPNTHMGEILCALHPTPAVCGTPRSEARQAISELEGFNREFFTGCTGYIDHEGNGEWVVNIRCGLVNPRKVEVYAGAGIVEGSDPEKEWQETVAKMRPLLSLLGIEDTWRFDIAAR